MDWNGNEPYAIEWNTNAMCCLLNGYAPRHHSIRITAVLIKMHTKGASEEWASARNDIRCTITIITFVFSRLWRCNSFDFFGQWVAIAVALARPLPLQQQRLQLLMITVQRVSFCLMHPNNLKSMLELRNPQPATTTIQYHRASRSKRIQMHSLHNGIGASVKRKVQFYFPLIPTMDRMQRHHCFLSSSPSLYYRYYCVWMQSICVDISRRQIRYQTTANQVQMKTKMVLENFKTYLIFR